MTNRYELLITSIAQTNAMVLNFFFFAVGMLAAWHVLGWLPPAMIRPARWLYIVSLLALSILATVFFGAG